MPPIPLGSTPMRVKRRESARWVIARNASRGRPTKRRARVASLTPAQIRDTAVEKRKERMGRVASLTPTQIDTALQKLEGKRRG
jgi:hypothetical protein